VLCCVLLRCAVLRCIALCCVVLRCAVLRCIALCCVVLYCVLLCCVALCCVALCCVVLCLSLTFELQRGFKVHVHLYEKQMFVSGNR
jgi:hypothetical protein